MTREEAKEALSVLKIYDAPWLREAIDMAIEALSAKPQTDLISRADALRELNGACSNWEDDAKVAEIINALPSADAEWIPCSERLPIPPTFCLVTTDGSHGDVIDIALYMSDGWHKASEVIAWRPLPKPYKGGDDE